MCYTLLTGNNKNNVLSALAEVTWNLQIDGVISIGVAHAVSNVWNAKLNNNIHSTWQNKKLW